jgi:hypothetical protein
MEQSDSLHLLCSPSRARYIVAFHVEGTFVVTFFWTLFDRLLQMRNGLEVFSHCMCVVPAFHSLSGSKSLTWECSEVFKRQQLSATMCSTNATIKLICFPWRTGRERGRGCCAGADLRFFQVELIAMPSDNTLSLASCLKRTSKQLAASRCKQDT